MMYILEGHVEGRSKPLLPCGGGLAQRGAFYTRCFTRHAMIASYTVCDATLAEEACGTPSLLSKSRLGIRVFGKVFGYLRS